MAYFSESPVGRGTLSFKVITHHRDHLLKPATARCYSWMTRTKAHHHRSLSTGSKSRPWHKTTWRHCSNHASDSCSASCHVTTPRWRHTPMTSHGTVTGPCIRYNRRIAHNTYSDLCMLTLTRSFLYPQTFVQHRRLPLLVIPLLRGRRLLSQYWVFVCKVWVPVVTTGWPFGTWPFRYMVDYFGTFTGPFWYIHLETIQFTEEDILHRLKILNNNKSPGPDGLHPRILHEIRYQITQPLKFIFEYSYKHKQLPSDWRSANISAIHKKGNKTTASNYRPISLTSLVCKIFESIIRDGIMNHFLVNKPVGDWFARS